MTQRFDPDTGDEITEEQWQRLRRDVQARLPKLSGELNDLIRRAQILNIDVNVDVAEYEEPKTGFASDKVVSIPVRVQPKKYPQIHTRSNPKD